MTHVSFQSALLFAAALLSALMGIYVVSRRPGDTARRAFFVFTSGTAIWTGSIASLILDPSLLWSDIVLFGGLLTIGGLLFFILIFSRQCRSVSAFVVSFVPLILCSIGIPFGSYVSGIHVDESGIPVPENGPMFPIYAAAIGIYVCASFIILARQHRRSSGILRLQTQYLLLGISVFIWASFVSDALLPAFGFFDLNFMAPAFSLVFVMCAAYAMIRHRLMGMRILIQRSAVYAALFGVVLGIYIVFLWVLSFVFEEAVDVAARVSAGITVILGVFGAPYLEKTLRRMTDRLFFKDTYDPTEALERLVKITARDYEIDDLARNIGNELAEIFRARSVDIVFRGSGSAVRGKDDLVIPVSLHDGGEYAEIVMGQKRSGDPYTREDVMFLTTFSYQAASAFRKAELYGQVKRHALELEEKVKERTGEIRSLQKAQERAMVEISHELQTPLAAVKGEIGLLKTHVPHSRHVGAFERSIEGVSKFIQDLLTLARLESAEGQFRLRRVDASTLMKELVEYFRISAMQEGIYVEADIGDGISVWGVRERIEEVVLNVLGNAMKYMKKEGEKRISVSLLRSGPRARIIIHDTGIGISKKDLPHVFDRFYRVSESRVRGERRGSGLGLAITKHIVEKMDGSIRAESVLGEWTSFMISLRMYPGKGGG